MTVAAVGGVGLLWHSTHVITESRSAVHQFRDNVSAAATTSATNPTTTASARPPTSPAQPPTPAFTPTFLKIASLSVTAPIAEVLSTNHELVPPDNPKLVGWWVASALAGSPTGTTVIVGHVDSATAGLGALFHIDRLHAGAGITITGPTSTAAYRVDSLTLYSKNNGLPAALFTATGASRLVLISCGGTFNTTTRSYRDNIVVTARLTSARTTR